ncbi:MAG: transglutaminase-like domain-containing protein [Syntrophaceae bacterium]
MSKITFKRHWIVGGGFVLLFFVLLAIRLDLFHQDVGGLFQMTSQKTTDSAGFQESRDRETWMKITQNGQKIGYAHRSFANTGKGYHFVESVFMQINTMGVTQGMTFKTDGYLNPDMTLSSFDFELRSSLFAFKVHGVVNGKQVTLYTEMPGSEKKTVITLKEAPYLSNSILDPIRIAEMKEGETRKAYVFDPASLGQRPVKVTYLGEETLTVMGQSQKTRKVSVEFMKASQYAWIGESGDIVKEQGILGITLEKVSKHEAFGKFTFTSSADLTEIASIPSNMVLSDPAALASLKVRIDIGEKDTLVLNGGRQTLQQDILLIQKETIPMSSHRETNMTGIESFLKPSPFIQSDHEKIVKKVREIISPDDPPAVKASKLVSWVHKSVQKRPVLSVPNALETLTNLVGDCNEHAVLLAALARAAGIPAQVEAGLVYQRGKFYYHAWNVLYIGAWVTADAVMGQMPADVTHIRFVRGEADQQIDLIGIIGKVRLTVLDKSR